MSDGELRTDVRTEPDIEVPSQESPTGPHRLSRVIRRAATAVAVTAGCAVLTWTALSVTREDVKATSMAQTAKSCAYTLSDPGKPVPLPPTAAPRSDRPYTVAMATNMGTVTFETINSGAPCATNSFVHLARSGYYSDRVCPRVTTKNIFILECGAPADEEGSTDPGYFFTDENLVGASYKAGTVAMSKVVPGRNGSQFFISYGDPVLHMPASWTPFGTVVSGLDVLQKIAANGTEQGTADGRPEKSVVIKSVTVR
ncbi:peptidylprolyl isomerase [Streptomyces sp. NPDC086787]|uniref:peptidylprolyl isomerase n=1 Tax=Streptomyces sp. NPDC086787 TaxID=3365759 RepID=UPI0037F2DA72